MRARRVDTSPWGERYGPARSGATGHRPGRGGEAVELDRESDERGWRRGMVTDPPEPTGEFGRFAAAVAWGGVWNREELSDRERRSVALTVLALGGREGPCALHLEAAMPKGELDAAAVGELAVTLAACAGLPVGTSFAMLAARVRDELEAETDRG